MQNTETNADRDVQLREADERVYFPLHGFSDSLNVSSSVALILDALIER